MKKNSLVKHSDYVNSVFREALIKVSKDKRYVSDLNREIKNDFFCLIIEKNKVGFFGLDYDGLVDTITNTSVNPKTVPIYLDRIKNSKLVVFGKVTKNKTDLIYYCSTGLVGLLLQFDKLINN